MQDWYWWKRQGDPRFSEDYLKLDPDMPGAIKALHDQHLHTVISVWAVTDAESQTYKDLKEWCRRAPGGGVPLLSAEADVFLSRVRSRFAGATRRLPA